MALSTGTSLTSRERRLLGALLGGVAFGVHMVSVVLNVVMHASVRDRITPGAVLGTAIYAVAFVAGGALAGWVGGARPRWLGYLAGGGLGGALVWSYLTVTWPVTARASSVGPPSLTLLESLQQGAVLGGLAGLLLLAIVLLRGLLSAR